MIRDYIDIEWDGIMYEVEFTFSLGSYGNGYDEAPTPHEIDSLVVTDEEGEICTLYAVEEFAEEEAYAYIDENY